MKQSLVIMLQNVCYDLEYDIFKYDLVMNTLFLQSKYIRLTMVLT